MEKQLSTIGYWLGLICTVLALIFRIFLAFEINPPSLRAASGTAISYLGFFHGAALFFLTDDHELVLRRQSQSLSTGVTDAMMSGRKSV